MLNNLKKIPAIILYSAIISANFQLKSTAAFADTPVLTEKINEGIKIEIKKSNIDDAINGFSGNYKLILKGFSGLFNKNSQELTGTSKITQINNKLKKTARTKQITHRSLAVGINEEGKIQTGRMIWPTTKVSVISGYGPRGRSFHHGIDIYNSYGADVYSVFKGTVSYSGWMSGYGNLVEVKHKNGLSTRYAHLSGILVNVGESVSAGDVIGKVGNTGRVTCTHLHFEVRMNGSSVPPLGYLR